MGSHGQQSALSPRLYQLEMLRLAKRGNVVVKLDTGTGKTFIASMLIKHMLPTTQGKLEDGGKRIVFLVKQVQLVVQQSRAIRQHTFLDKEVGEYHGQLKPPVDFWSKDKWWTEFQNHRILVFSACVFKDILNHAKFSLDKVSLLIFDECHHTAKEDDYAQIVKHFSDFPTPFLPRILGLTASVVNGKIKGGLISNIASLERRMRSRLVTSANPAAKLISQNVTEKVIPFNEDNPTSWDIYHAILEGPLSRISAAIKKRKNDKQTVLMIENDLLDGMAEDSNSSDEEGIFDSDGDSSDCDDFEDLSMARFVKVRVFGSGGGCVAVESRSSDSVEVSERYFNLLCGDEDNPVKRAKRALSDCNSVLKDLGPWCALAVAEAALADLQACEKRFQLSADEGSLVLLGVRTLATFIENLKAAGVAEAPVTNRWISHRALTLVNMLKNLYHSSKSASEVPHGIVFVKERQAAFALARLLKESAVVLAGCGGNMRVDFVTGHGLGNLQHKEVGMDIEHQTKVLEKFRRGDCNVLIATRVVEEGMDVRACNLVIKFTDPEDYRSYVQSKGRARMGESKYYVFAPMRCREQITEKLRNFHDITVTLDRLLLDRVVDGEWYDDDAGFGVAASGFDFRPFGLNGPRITLNSAMSLLNRYIGSLRHDCARIPRLHIYISEDPRNPQAKRGNLYLPMPCPVRQKIVGKFAHNVRYARKFVALEACKKLFEFDELGQDLLPKPPIKAEEEEEEEEETDEHGNRLPKMGSRKRRRKYPLEVSPALNPPSDSDARTVGRFIDSGQGTLTLHLYVFSMDPEMSDAESHMIGILVKEPILPKADEGEVVAEFPLFLPTGVSQVSTIYCGPQELSAAKCRVVRKFQRAAMSTLVVVEDLDFDLDDAQVSCLTPLVRRAGDGFALDMETMQTTQERAGLRHQLRPGMLLRTTHRRAGGKEVWKVEEVNETLNPLSPFPDPAKGATFREYYRLTYGVLVKDLRQPLLRVSRLHSLADKLLRPREGSMERAPKHDVLLLPELCQRVPLSAGVWTAVRALPAALARLNQLLLLHELRETFPPDEEDVDRPPGAETVSLGGRDLTPLLEATTSTSYGDFVDLERLEIVGDSFLKFAVSVTLHATANGVREQEGHLTVKRMRLIRNANLFRLGNYMTRYLKHEQFTVARHFIPPGFRRQRDSGSWDSDDPWEVEIPDKTIADCTEALIGYALMYHRKEGAMKFLKRLDLDIDFEEDNGELQFPPIPDPLLPTGKHKLARIEKMYDGFEKIEKKLRYKFERREFLLQALTHASCIDHPFTECYQKLEYLGDAVLDFIITRVVFHRNPDVTPGKLTDIRSALVNNRTFAALAVKLKLHLHLKHSDPKLFQLIPQFAASVTSVENMDENYLFGSCEQKLTMKILGDLFESVAGAVYLDCGRNLNKVARVFCGGIMKILIDEYSRDPPINPVRQLYEKYPDFEFSEPVIDKENGQVTVTGKGICGSFTAQNQNKKLCKFDIACMVIRQAT